MNAVKLIICMFGLCFAMNCFAEEAVVNTEKMPVSSSVTTEKRNLSDFTALNIEGAYKVKVNIGQPLVVSLTGAPVAISHVITEVKGNTLSIHSKNNLSLDSDSPVTIAMTVPNLKNINLAGSNDVVVSDFKGDNLTLNTSGKQEIDLLGSVNTLIMELTGTNALDAQKLIAQTVKLKATGFSQVKVYAANEFHIQSAGNVDVMLFGNPKIMTTSMFGGGRLKVNN